MRYVYLDNNATTPCDNVVLNAMLPFFREQYANPGSPHVLGKRALSACSDARERVAELLHCTESEVVFTSGATESNNLLLLGLTPETEHRRRLIVSQIEHKSIQLPSRKRRDEGFDVCEVSVTVDGVVDLNVAERLIDDQTALVSIQAANNETGVLQPIQELADVAHSRGALFHCDAAQWIGKLPTGGWIEHCDYLSISAHKFYGPKGVGVLMVRSGLPRRVVAPIIYGGGQEGGLRSGTSNVANIVGCGIACTLASERVKQDEVDVAIVRDRFEDAITSSLPGAWINGACVRRLPGSCSLTIPGIPASMLVANLTHVCIGEGSACTSGAAEPSHVLVAMGLSRDEAECTVRISFGRDNTVDHANQGARAIVDAVTRIFAKSAVEPPVSHHVLRRSPDDVTG